MKILVTVKRRRRRTAAVTALLLAVYLFLVLHCRSISNQTVTQQRTSSLYRHKEEEEKLELQQRREVEPSLVVREERREKKDEEVGNGGRSSRMQLSSSAARGVGRVVAVRVERRSLQELLGTASPADNSSTWRRREEGEVTPTVKTHSTNRAPLTPITPAQPPPPHQSFSSPLLNYLSPAHCLPLSPRKKVLAFCEQTQPLPFTSLFTQQMIESVEKVGEGTFSVVFGCTSESGEYMAVKIIPVEGSQLYNDEPQTTYKDALTEMVIMKELSLLGGAQENNSLTNFTENFLKIHNVGLVQGEFPVFLLQAWDSYAKSHSVENDRPDLFPADQLYVVMATENAGISLENYQFSRVEEAVSVLCQVAGALAVGEAALEMEHRDLHMSNVLVKKTDQEYLMFRLDEREFKVQSRGVKATIVDYNLSRMKQGDCVSFTDLEKLPWLFEGKGDPQFQVYRDMKKATRSQWQQFHPSTNTLWLAFLSNKLSQRALELGPAPRRHWRAALRHIVRNISGYSSAHDAFLHEFF